MDIRQYDKKRDELVGFIDQALQLKCDLPERIKENLTAIRSKVYENQFRIVLISEFESGKSTTFNAICGGQEISPRGHMLRTSGTVVSAQNTLDEKKINTADVIWRSDRELLLCFAKYLVQSMKQIDPVRFEKCAHGEQLCGMLRLPQDIPLIKKAVKTRIKEFGSSIIPTDEEEALRIALLICEFYEDTMLDQMKQMKRFSVSDVEKMVCFPAKWADFDLKSKQIPLNAYDCIFLFVKEVKLYIQSESLKRSGSVIIDCPGLSASDYDTKVAFDIVENADAIWMLYNGRGLGQEDIEYAGQLLQLKNKHIFFTVNSIANSDDNIQTHIIPNYVKTLKKLKSKATAKDFHVYNALLALLALQAEKFMDGTLDEHSIQTIKSHAPKRLQGMGIDIIIQSKVEDILGHTYGYSSLLLKQMNFDLFAKDKSGIAFIRELSGLDKIIEKLENAVIEQKAKSILIDNGSEKVIELLKQVEADLQVVEQAALSDEEKVKADFEAAERKLQQFETFCEDELEILDDAVIDRSLALDYWEQVIVASIDEVAEKAAIRISNVHLNEVRQDVNEQIVNEVFSEVVLPKATNWANDIRSGENAAFNSLMDSKIKKIIRNTEKEWELLLEEQPLLSGLPVPTPVIGTDVMATDFVDSVVAKTPGISKDVFVGSATGFAIGATIGSFIFPGVGTAIGGFLGGVIGAAAGEGMGTDKREKFIREELKKELTQNIVLGDSSGNETKNSILAKQEKRMRVLREGIINAFQAAYADTQTAFATRQAEALKIYEHETAQRKAIAERHAELRTSQIAPLRKNIEKFKQFELF